MANQTPIHRPPARQRRHLGVAQTVHDRHRAQPAIGSAPLHDHCFGLWRHLMRTRQRPRRRVDESFETFSSVSWQPVVNRLTSDFIPAGDISDRCPVKDFQDSFQTLFHTLSSTNTTAQMNADVHHRRMNADAHHRRRRNQPKRGTSTVKEEPAQHTHVEQSLACKPLARRHLLALRTPADQGKYVCRRGDLNPHALSSASPSS